MNTLAKKGKWRRIATYIYRDETGVPLFRVVRLERGEGAEREKDFFQERYENGKWANGLRNIRRVPYRLEKIIGAKRVFLVEGEKDVKTLERFGLIASTAPMGAGKWTDDYSAYFIAKAVVIILDNDAPGRAHAVQVAASLLNVATSVRVLELPNLPEKGDVTDWVRAGGTVDELKQLMRAITGLDQGALSELATKWGVGTKNAMPDDSPVATALAKIAAIKSDLHPTELEIALRNTFSDLAGADQLQRETVREACVKKLKDIGASAPARLVDAALSVNSENEPIEVNGSVVLNDIEPWADAVDGGSLLNELTSTIRRFVVLREHEVTGIAMWILHAHAFDVSDCSPFLLITSPDKRCGKTRLLSVIAALVPRALAASNITPAAIFRTIEACRPVLLVDEADTFIHGNDELRGILNSGHTRQFAFVIRLIGEAHEPKRFSTWCPKAVALIGKPPQTIEDRSIVIHLHRKTSSEPVEKWTRSTTKALEPLNRKVARWVADNCGDLEAAMPQVPDLGSDRAEDNWLPLLAIADSVGGDWPEQARQAAKAISRGLREDESPRVILLGDLRHLFEAKKVDRLPSEKIIQSLGRMEDRPWPEWKQGKPITTTQLANELKPFGIRPRTIRLPDGSTPKGYKLADFEDTFLRYLPGQAATPATRMKNAGLSKK